MSDLIERLRNAEASCDGYHDCCNEPMCSEAADKIERLTALADQIRTDWIPANRQLKARVDELEGALVEIANSGIGSHSAWGWIAPFAHKALEGEGK